MKKIRMLFSAGGTGGHIFPALAVANKLMEMNENIEIRFVGAEGKMEMQKVPAAGYPITGLPVMGFPRKPTIKIFAFINKLLKSMRRAKRMVKDFQPHIAVGFGGYASGPALRAAASVGVPIVLQEQNSYAGITNRLLAKKAKKICVAYENMDRFFPAEKIIITGNPIRKNLIEEITEKCKACRTYGFDENRKTVFVTGGSLGARSINEAVLTNIRFFEQENIQLLWQCGSLYIKEFTERLGFQVNENIHMTKFIDNMDVAYACADVIISRAGAGTLSELCVIGKPSILVPSPNVAEDHQTHNAKALSDKNAAVLLPDDKVKERLHEEIAYLLRNENAAREMADNMKKMALPDADKDIANEIMKLVH